MSPFDRRVPIVFQGESNECGLACLCMLLNHYGNHTDLLALRILAPGGQPQTLEQISELAKHHGLETRSLRCEIEDFAHIRLPAIVHMDFDHFVILEKASRRNLVILDPARGRLSLSSAAFSKRFTGILLELGPGTTFATDGDAKHYSPLGFFSTLPKDNLPSALMGLLVLSLVVQVFALVTPFLLQIVVDEVLTMNNPDMAVLVTWGFAAVYILSATTQWFRGLLSIRLGSELSYIMAAGLLNRVTALPLTFFHRRSIGDIVSRFGSLKPLQEFISHGAVRVFLDLLMTCTTFIMILCFSMRIALFVSLTTAIYLALQYLFLAPYRRHSHEHLVSDAGVQSHFIETIQSIGMIKRFTAVNRRRNDWLNQYTVSLNAQVKARRWELVFEITRYLLGASIILGVVYLSVSDIAASAMTIGMLYSLVAYSGHFSNAILSISSEWQSWSMLNLHVQRLSDITDHATDTRVPFSANAIKVEMRNLHFKFSGSQTELFFGLNLMLDANSKVAILGPSGSGKTTLLAILKGEEQPVTGNVYIDDRPLSQLLNPVSLYSTLQQGDNLLAGTVMDNITFFDPAPDEARLFRATQLACIHQDILQLPLAYQEKLNDQGCTLSAGQKQRLLLARALYRPANMLLLDEGTSHLDSAIEFEVMQNILSEPGICFFITHREHIARLADHIIRLGEPQSLQ
jgi:ATP-binding cassette subfamily B protein RaxB